MKISPLIVGILVAGSLLPRVDAREPDLVEAGVPAMSRVWMGDDYARAAEVIASGKVPLPVLSTEEGRKFFQRVTAVDNLSTFLKPIAPVRQRLALYAAFLRGLVEVFQPYATAAGKGAGVHTELAMLQAFMLRAAVVGIQLSDEAIASTPPDQRNPLFDKGLAQMRSGMTNIFSGAQKSLSETKFYTSEDRSELLAAMAETLPKISQAFSADFAKELRQRLDEARGANPTLADAKALDSMLETLKKLPANRDSL